VIYGLAVAGAAGVTTVLQILRTEFESALALTGRPIAADLDRTVCW
jgi:4-hydroxymandelate oxidase